MVHNVFAEVVEGIESEVKRFVGIPCQSSVKRGHSRRNSMWTTFSNIESVWPALLASSREGS